MAKTAKFPCGSRLKKGFLSLDRTVTLKLSINGLYILALYVAFMWSEPAAEAAWNMHEFVDEGLFSVFS